MAHEVHYECFHFNIVFHNKTVFESFNSIESINHWLNNFISLFFFLLWVSYFKIYSIHFNNIVFQLISWNNRYLNIFENEIQNIVGNNHFLLHEKLKDTHTHFWLDFHICIDIQIWLFVNVIQMCLASKWRLDLI